MKNKKQKNNVGYRIMGNYEITYKSNGFKQNKILISKYDWGNIFQPIKKAISIIEDSNKGKPSDESNLLKESLKIMFGNYDNCFPEESPLHLSIKNGDLILPPQQGGIHKVSWKLFSQFEINDDIHQYHNIEENKRESKEFFPDKINQPEPEETIEELKFKLEKLKNKINKPTEDNIYESPDIDVILSSLFIKYDTPTKNGRIYKNNIK